MTIEGEVSDALKGLEFLLRDPDVDTDRLGIFGRSFGGVIAVLAANRFGRIRSVAMWAPVFNGDQWADQWRLLQSEEFCDEERQNRLRINGQTPGYHFFKELFSLRMEEEFQGLNQTAFLHIHGEKDNIIDIKHANDYMKLRRLAKGETRFIRLPHSDHDFSHPSEQQFALEETCAWFEKTLM
jgi:dipeptidyl aminopeptidase/acylaminoacyl peptidase